MIYIQKHGEPSKLQSYRRTINACFDDMDADVKEELRETLLKEQGHLCAYCMRRICAEKDVKIEHLEPRNSDNELDYHNLLVVCKGNEGQPHAFETCDTRKKNKTLSFSPLQESDMDTIYYCSNGEVHSSSHYIDNDINIILNLNFKNGFLISNRKTALQALRNELRKNLNPGQDAKPYLRKLKSHYDGQSDYMPEYIGIIRWYIDKKLEK